MTPLRQQAEVCLLDPYGGLAGAPLTVDPPGSSALLPLEAFP